MASLTTSLSSEKSKNLLIEVGRKCTNSTWQILQIKIDQFPLTRKGSADIVGPKPMAIAILRENTCQDNNLFSIVSVCQSQM